MPDSTPRPRADAPDFTVRAPRAADAAELARLFDTLGYPFAPDVIAARLAAYTAAGERALVAAEHAEDAHDVTGRLLGLVTLHVTLVLHRPAPVGRVTALVVDADMRGRGVGRALVTAAEALLRDAGCHLVEVTSNRRRTDAHAFYERLGYVVTSLRFAKTVAGDD